MQRSLKLTADRQFVNRLIIEFFPKYKENVGASYVKYTTYTDILDLVEPGHKKTKK